MKRVFYITILSLFTILTAQYCYAQNKKYDSLWVVYNNKALPDISRLRAINTIAYSFRKTNSDTAIILAESELRLANSLPKAKGKKWAARALYIIATSYLYKSNYPKAFEFYFQELKIREEIADTIGRGACFVNIGIAYKELCNYPKALEYYLKALKLFEEIRDKKLMTSCYTNIGAIYQGQSNYSKSLEYYLLALKICEANGYKENLGFCYSNIGIVYQDLLDNKKALECFLKSLKIRTELGDEIGMGMCYLNIGTIYHYPSEYTNYAKALEYYLKSLQLAKKTDDKLGVAICYVDLGELNIKLTNYKLAILYSDSCLQITKEIGDIDDERLGYDNLATAYSKTGNYKLAYESHVKFKTLTDSIFNAENSKLLGDMKTQFEVEKKEAELKIKAEAQDAISIEEKKKQRIIMLSVISCLLLVIVFSIFLYNRFKMTQKQKKVIEGQKVLVDKAYEHLHEKNKEVMDSIYYARRIQRSLLPTENYIEKHLNRLRKSV